jgi:two-component sensor histidine kinase
MKIVIVDDSRADRKLLRILLEETLGPSLEFSEAANGERGLAACRLVHPDCVLIDYKLPDMTGLKFVERLRSGESDAAVVMLTYLDSGEVAAAALKAGAQDYLLKEHVSAATLNRAVQNATQKVTLSRALESERDRLSRSLAEKEVLLKEVHHRIKNNLQVIASLLRLQANALEDERLAGALLDSQHRVESMALIHEQLYESEDLREVDVARHAALLADNLYRSYGADPARITIRVTLEPIPLTADQAIPVGLILNELISNALKHAFPDGRRGVVSIEGGLRDGQVVLEVRDDGAGIPAGAARGRRKSLGLEIVNILSRQLKGTLELDRRRGAAFRVSFPGRPVRHEIKQRAGSGG